MKGKYSPYFPLFHDECFNNHQILKLTNEQFGIYIKFRALCAVNSDDSCSLPNDDKYISKLLHIPLSKWLKIKSIITGGTDPLIVIENNNIFHKKHKAFRECSQSKSKVLSENAKKRHAKNKEHFEDKSLKNNDEGHAIAYANAHANAHAIAVPYKYKYKNKDIIISVGNHLDHEGAKAEHAEIKTDLSLREKYIQELEGWFDMSKWRITPRFIMMLKTWETSDVSVADIHVCMESLHEANVFPTSPMYIEHKILDFVASRIKHKNYDAVKLKISAKSTKAEALSAWDEVMKYVKKGDGSTKPKFSHPITQSIIDSWGWKKLLQNTLTNIQFKQNDFIELFNSKMGDKNAKISQS